MRRQAPIVLLLALLGSAAGGCTLADTGAFVRLQEEVEEVKRQVAAVRSTPPPAAPAAVARAERIETEDVAALRKSVADLAADTDRVKSDLLATSTRLDETKVALQKEVSRLNGTTAELGQSLQDVKARLARIDEIERRLAAIEEKVARIAAAQPPPAAAPAAGAGEWKSPEEMYDYALGLVKSGETRRGREVLNAFAAKYPDHRLMQNVYYWKGETFYAEKDYESAVLAFQDVIDKFPGGDKVPDAMLKQGLSFQALKDKRSARTVLELVVSKYPKSPAAEKARQKLAELK